MASTPRKRGYEPNEYLQIKLANAAPLTVNRLLMATFSGCERGLPADAECWDLCNMLLEGVPVKRAVVVAWLNAVYLQVENAAFETQHPSELSTLSGFAQVDAVDSSKGLICALVTQLQRQSVTATVQLSQLQVSISTSLCHIWDQRSSGWGLYSYSPSSADTVKQGLIMSSDQKAQIIRLLAEQAEAALHIGYKLRLPYVQTLLYNFIRVNSCWFNSLLHGALNHIFSERVLYVAAGVARVLKEQLAASATT